MADEDLRELLDEVYTTCFVSKADVLEEKQDLVNQYMTINALFFATFKENRHISKALSYFSRLMQDFFAETDFESIVYDMMISYFEQLENLTDMENRELLEEFNAILDEFDSKVDRRFFEAQEIFEHYLDIIEAGILTDKNYYYRGLTNKTSEDDRRVILGKIPEVKKNV